MNSTSIIMTSHGVRFIAWHVHWLELLQRLYGDNRSRCNAKIWFGIGQYACWAREVAHPDGPVYSQNASYMNSQAFFHSLPHFIPLILSYATIQSTLESGLASLVCEAAPLPEVYLMKCSCNAEAEWRNSCYRRPCVIMAQSQKRSWLCCFRPRVAEAEDGSKTRKEPSPSAPKQEKEDSANGDGPARLSVGVPERTQSDELEDFGSPASSYVTCFSEQDPHDIGDSLRWAAGARACSTECNTHNPMVLRDE